MTNDEAIPTEPTPSQKVEALLNKAADEQAKQQEADSKEQKLQQLRIRMHQLRNLLVHINSRLPNRRARRQFWNEFVKNETMQVAILDHILEQIDGKGVMEVPSYMQGASDTQA